MIGELRQVFRVDIVGHFDHQAALSLTGFASEAKSLRLCFRVAGMAELTLDTEVAFVLAHELDDIVACDVFAEHSGCWSDSGAGLCADQLLGFVTPGRERSWAIAK